MPVPKHSGQLISSVMWCTKERLNRRWKEGSMDEGAKGKPAKRYLKVYRGHFPICRHRYKAHPVIRLGGIYLAALKFQIGDAIEVATEDGRIVITKVTSNI